MHIGVARCVDFRGPVRPGTCGRLGGADCHGRAMSPIQSAYTKGFGQCWLKNREAGIDNTKTGFEATPDIGADHAVRDVGKVEASDSVDAKSCNNADSSISPQSAFRRL